MENTAVSIIQYAMEMERNGQRFYTHFKDQVKGEKAKKVFEGLAKAEEEHYQILKEALENLLRENAWSQGDPLPLEQASIFELVKEEENLYPSRLESDISDLAIMRMAYLIEHDFAEFYRKSLDRIRDL
ncbi:ferritin-like domain-containing protein [Thermotalea metallivorans]|uniref:Rubrerythrin diiron-binding domain-containing protein n=1 Tax=Thermotalea metallivorans TaxID=520762 RepID=A0A140LEM7_9FIRM|nr:ferritin family protein [Thermotalea metallivorans]KXG79002.1 hypothetical protein AN619_00320 [Thermotalea metallivorans]